MPRKHFLPILHTLHPACKGWGSEPFMYTMGIFCWESKSICMPMYSFYVLYSTEYMLTLYLDKYPSRSHCHALIRDRGGVLTLYIEYSTLGGGGGTSCRYPRHDSANHRAQPSRPDRVRLPTTRVLTLRYTRGIISESIASILHGGA